jgi:hypothetical protein
MTPSDLRDVILAAGGEIEFATGGDSPDGWHIYARLPKERLKILATAAQIAWGYEEDFDRWANSRDAVTPLPRDAEQFATMVVYLNVERWKRNEAFVSYREAQQWRRKQGQ